MTFRQAEIHRGAMSTIREDVIRFVKKKYKTEIEYLWARYPSYGVFRHGDNQKWFGLIMDVSCAKLGLTGDEIVDILNVKLDSPLLVDLLIQQEGYLPGYHIRRGNWVSILLDGTVPLKDICGLIDKSYQVTASAKTKQENHPPKEWIIPSNLKYFDGVHAFDSVKEINWKQGAGIKKGDTVFLYVGAPVSAILYKCKVTQTDIPYFRLREGLTIKGLMKIRLLKRYDPRRFTFVVLKEQYRLFAVRGPRSVPEDLSEDLKL